MPSDAAEPKSRSKSPTGERTVQPEFGSNRKFFAKAISL